ncbi:hypothetical protein D3C78_20500 [compost metagenome]
MTFSELSQYLSESIGRPIPLEKLQVEDFDNLYSLDSKETINSGYANKSIAGHVIYVTGTPIRFAIVRCADATIQESYERRVIEGSIAFMTKFSETLIIKGHVSSEFCEFNYDEYANIAYVPIDSVSHVSIVNGIRVLGVVTNEPEEKQIRKFILKIGQTVGPILDNYLSMPEWLNAIHDQGGLYVTPTNRHRQSEIKYLDLPDNAYVGNSLFVIPDIYASIRLQGVWVPVFICWLDIEYITLPQEIQDEYLLYKSYQTS